LFVDVNTFACFSENESNFRLALLSLVPASLRVQVGVFAELIGMDVETVNMVLGMFLCYPLGLIILQIPYGKPRHLFSFLLGAFLLQFVLGVQWIHQLISTLIAYAMILVLPRKTLKLALPIFAFLYCVLGHLHRQYTNYMGWDLDFTGSQMVTVMKLYMVAHNLWDGQLLTQGKEDAAAKKCARFALQDAPGFLEFLGYMFCFSNVLVGPATEYTVYLRNVDGSLFLKKDGSPKGKIPSNVWPTLQPLLVSCLNMVVFLVIDANFPILDAEDPQKNTPTVLQEQFLQNSLLYRYAYLMIGLLGVRQKYYFGWKNAEGANNIWYAGFDGFDETTGKALGWDTCSNMDILGFEFAPDIQQLTRTWNKKTSIWLNRYVYSRTGGSLLAVYALNAFWHGFYPGYYLFFLQVPILTFCDRLAKKKLSPRWGNNPVYGFLGMMASVMSANYLVIGFVMLAFNWTFDLWRSLLFIGQILPITYYVFLLALPTPKKKDDGSKAKTS
jgi:hypothetical protein